MGQVLLRNNLRTKSENNGCECPLSSKVDKKDCSELRPEGYEEQREESLRQQEHHVQMAWGIKEFSLF